MNGELIMQYKQLIIIYILLYFFLFIAAYFHLNLATSLSNAECLFAHANDICIA
jgi:hypothetical protein